MEEITSLEMLARVGTAAGLGALLGLEREVRLKAAGLRTHVIVAIGAAVFTIAGVIGAVGPAGNPTRVAAQVVTGIGFIGAGAIMRSGMTVSGLTTAGTLWLTASVGLAAGLGLVVLASIATGLAIATVVMVGPMRRLVARGGPRRIELIYHTGHGTLGPFVSVLNGAGGDVRRLSLKDEDDDLRHVWVEVSGLDSRGLAHVLATVSARSEVVQIESEPG